MNSKEEGLMILEREKKIAIAMYQFPSAPLPISPAKLYQSKFLVELNISSDRIKKHYNFMITISIRL